MRDRNRADLEFAALLLARRSRLRRVHARRKAGVAAVAALVLLTVVLAGAAASGRAVLLDSCSLNALQPVGLGQNSFVYADNGSLLGVIPSTVNRQPLRLDQISPYLRTATVAIEDRRFWEHGALDYRGIVRALYSDVTAGRIVQGGSTITQELVRNLYIGNANRTFSRKIKEACLAIKLAQVWTKPRILNAYLNEVFYGRAAHGAQAAAETFFSTRAQDLSLAQSALLAGLPQAPTVYDPLVHPATAMQRRDEVLRAMLANRAITTDEYTRAVAAPLGLKPGNLYTRQQHENFFGWAEQQLVAKYGAGRVAAGGLRVRTTLDPSMQESALSAVRGVLRNPSDPAAALVAIDPRTGAVRAMVGYLPDGTKLKFNLATQSTRTGGQLVQAVRARDRDPARHLAVLELLGAAIARHSRAQLRRAAGTVGRAQLRRRERGLHEPPQRDRELGEHDLRAARREDRSVERRLRWRTAWGSRRTCSRCARSRSGTQPVNPARDDGRRTRRSRRTASTTRRRRSSSCARRTAASSAG